MRHNDSLDDEDEMELDVAERRKMEAQMSRLQADMQRRGRAR